MPRAKACLRGLALVLALGLGPVGAEVLNLTPDEALMTARAAYLAGEVEAANRIAHALVTVTPEDARVQLLLAATEPKMGRPQAGLLAGRKAWRLARAQDLPRDLRYEIARNTAKAALDAGHPIGAQLWLRRSLDVAPDGASFDQSGRDLALVRDRNPWRLSFDLEAGPSDNLNGGSESSVFQIGDFILGSLSNGSQALAGQRISARLTAERALPASGRGQTVLTFGAEVVRNLIAASSRDEAGNMTSRDLDRSRLTFGLRRDSRFGAAERPLSYGVEIGHNWAGGQALGPTLGFSVQAMLAGNQASAVWLGGTAERSWEAGDPRGNDLYSLTLSVTRNLGPKASAALTVTAEAARSAFINSTYDAARISLDIDPGWRLGPASVTLGANAGLRDYDAFSIGFANVTDGRTDRSYGVSMDFSFDDWTALGFAPVLSLRHGKTESNISRYDSVTTGVSIGISSVF